MTNEELVEKIQNGIDIQENMGLLYEQNKKFIFQIVKPYSKIIEIEDLMQEAYFGLHNAALRFDLKSEYKFLTYARYAILGKVNIYCKNIGKMKRLPSHLLERISKYHKFIVDYEKINNEKPNDDEIIQYLQIDKKQYRNLKKYIVEDNINSLNAPIGEDSTLENVIADEHIIEEEICDNILHEQLKKELWDEVDKLPNRTSRIIKSRYAKNLKLEDCASKENITRERIRQLEHNGLKVLRQNENVKKIANEYFYNTSLGYKGNLASFKNNNASVVEMMVIKKIEKEKDMLKRIEQMEEKRKKLLASLV